MESGEEVSLNSARKLAAPAKNDRRARRFVTFNVCGIKNVLQFPPWNKTRTFESMFAMLDADVVCFQETKIQRRDVTREMALVEGYNCFFTFPASKKGYSGVAIYVKNDIPVYKAEDGLTGWLNSERSEEQRVRAEPGRRRHSYRDQQDSIGGYPDNIDEKTGIEIDSEGRCVVLDLAYCVVIGLYCPADSMGDRTEYRSAFYETLDIRIRKLVAMGRNVVVLGDLNVTREIIDSAPGRQEWVKEGKLSKGNEGKDISIDEFLQINAETADLWRNGSEVRKIFHKWIDPNGGVNLIDSTRARNPNKWGMYTCWNQVIDARPGNFGSRIDYILISKEINCIGGDILPELYGSDHCPVYADIIWEGKETDNTTTMPRMCATFLPQFLVKQGNVRKLFSSYSTTTTSSSSSAADVIRTHTPLDASRPTSVSQLTLRTHTPPMKTKRNAATPIIKKPKQQKIFKSQSSILSFWKKNIHETSSESVTPETDTPTLQTNPTSSNEWKKIFTPATPPLCQGHQEPCKLLISKKNGMNKGRAFWICSR